MSAPTPKSKHQKSLKATIRHEERRLRQKRNPSAAWGLDSKWRTGLLKSLLQPRNR